ncbi:MAG: HAMP domain-containing histidine kinase, partial [Lachnospiraceae bacterium]|nr:HAMP domain-containing histidine kinase [Lachnospiraceae bacterium]
KNDLIVYLAHDLKTPLTSVIGYLTLLRDEEQISDELRQKYLAISLDKAERLEELINEFFEITRFNLTQIALEYSRVNLTLLLEQLIFEFRPMLAENDLTCRLNAAPDIQIFCDADKIQRVFDNLLKNAVNYSYEGTEIVIMVEQDPRGSVTITFVNHGNTISESKLKRIFEQFYRLDTARSSKSGGAGLGLAISKQIVETHGGTIRAESADELIVFTVELPSEPRMAAPGPETESAGA